MKVMALRWIDFVDRKTVVGVAVVEVDMFEIFCVGADVFLTLPDKENKRRRTSLCRVEGFGFLHARICQRLILLQKQEKEEFVNVIVQEDAFTKFYITNNLN